MLLRRFTVFLIVALSILAAGSAFADARTYAVYPFEINGPAQYKYLSRGVQTMLISRLNWTGHFEPLASSKELTEADRPTSKLAEIKSAQKLGVDYLALGGLTIVGTDVAIDLRMVDKDGKFWTKSAKTTMEGLIPALDTLATEVKGQLFEKPGSKVASKEEKAREDARPKEALNPEFISASAAAVPMQSSVNPQFRYEGGTETPGRWRSQSINFVNRGGFVADVTGDGKKNIVMLSDHEVKVFNVEDQRLKEVTSYKYAARANGIRINGIDIGKDGVTEVVLCIIMEERPYSYIISFKNKTPKLLIDRFRNFLSAVRLPPNFSPSLLGQKYDSSSIFYSKSMTEYMYSNGELVPIRHLSVPAFANVFNTSYLPGKDDYKVLVLNKYGRITVYNKALEPLYESQDSYNSADVKFDATSKLVGFGSENKKDRIEHDYFVPMPITITSISDPTKLEVLLNKDISVASQIFSNYKSFSQGEIHSEYWDGVGLNLAWKTRRIKGTVTSYGIADIDNDGEKELYCILNTYPGALGVKYRKTLIVAYELNLGKK
ncbi:VCBS repeat-containing protein [Desulfovibrio sp. UCD-KL4C]|uniref:VCBS repeat-containing protein n=1 Tax=Desulfovibrio sp. UCD-KL4C TaxID=2578120 RepID=UPI0025C25852|nr:VCBS repeat-containing protein [Desulfovibrio sp. UCD-KL4C]